MLKKAKFLLLLLRPLGYIYGFLMILRGWLYRKGLLQSTEMSVPVISVGNLSMGGSGKTPVVIYLAKLLQRNGFRPAVVSRGYRGKAKDRSNVVSDGRCILMNVADSGDEPRLIAESVPGLVVITGKKRRYPCERAVEDFKCDVIILDDAFQHLAIRRNIDLVLFKADSHFHNCDVFPSGYQREPTLALHRASAFIITGCDPFLPQSLTAIEHRLVSSYRNKRVFRSQHMPRCFLDKDGKSYDINHIEKPVIAFCGIASPDRFKKTIEDMDIEIADFLSFNDHVNYSSSNITKIATHARKHDIDIAITTTKDFVKVRKLETDLRMYAIVMEVKFDKSFDKFILDSLENKTADA